MTCLWLVHIEVKRSWVWSFPVKTRSGINSGASQGSELLHSTTPSFSTGEKPGFLPPRDLPKHTPLISKSQSLRSVRGSESWARQRPDEERRPRLPRPVQRTQSVPAGRPARRCPSAVPRPRPKGSLRTGPKPRGRPWTGASASLPRKPSVPWQRQLDQPRDTDQALNTHRPVGKVRSSLVARLEERDEAEGQARLGSNMSALRCVTPGLVQPPLSFHFLLCTSQRRSPRGRAVRRQSTSNRKVRVFREKEGKDGGSGYSGSLAHSWQSCRARWPSCARNRRCCPASWSPCAPTSGP